MTVPVVRFDAELLVHRADGSTGCLGAVVTETPANANDPGAGTIRRVARCTLLSGHDGGHDAAVPAGRRSTVCGIRLDPALWIDWFPAPDDPLCPDCCGVVVDVQPMLLGE